MSNILLLANDAEVISKIDSFPKDGHTVRTINDPKDIFSAIKKYGPALLIIDKDFHNENILELYKKIQGFDPSVKAVALASGNDVSLAVAASKLGMAGFIRKPLEAQDFAEVITRALREQAVSPRLEVAKLPENEWLYGVSEKNIFFLRSLEEAASDQKEILLICEKGIPASQTAQIIHTASRLSARRFVPLDMRSFGSEAAEPHFWGLLKELLLRHEERDWENRVGTLFIDNFASCPDQLKKGILDFIKSGKEGGKFDPLVRVVLSLPASYIGEEDLSGFKKIVMPALRERKDDLPVLIDKYLAKFSKSYARQITGIAPQCLALLSYYDFPGNYVELEQLMRSAVLKCSSATLEIRHLSLNWDIFSYIIAQSNFAGLDFTLEAMRTAMEKNFYKLVLNNFAGDVVAAAKFSGLSKKLFERRLKELAV